VVKRFTPTLKQLRFSRVKLSQNYTILKQVQDDTAFSTSVIGRL